MLPTMTDQPKSPLNEYVQIPSSTATVTGRALGIDIGGTGIKAAVVDVATGLLVTERVRELAPHPSSRDAVLDVVVAIVRRLEVTGSLPVWMPAGVGFPSVIRAGQALTQVHGDSSWVDAPLQELLQQRLGRPVVVVNDADAAGVAEAAYGAGKDHAGVVLFLDLGTGIGSALFVNGNLVPNIQLGHIALHGGDAEARVSPVARVRRQLSWKKWAREFNELLAIYEDYLWPDLIIIGGGMAAKFPKFQRFLKTRAVLLPAALGTTAGIIGAARIGAAAVPAADDEAPGKIKPG